MITQHTRQTFLRSGPIPGFLAKTAVFIILLVIINRSTTAFLPAGWENDSYYKRRADFLKNYANTCNTLFFGSSRTFAHIDPMLYDSLNFQSGLHTNSFILASGSEFFNEMVWHIHNIFNNPSAPQKVEYLFIELDNLVTLTEVNLYTPRASYYITPKSTFTFVKRIWAERISVGDRITQTLYYLSSCLVNLTQSGYGRRKIECLIPAHPDDTPEIHEPVRGYVGLNTDLPQFRLTDLQKRHQDFMRDTTIIQRIFKSIEDADRVSSNRRILNPEVLRTCLDLITEFQARGIHVVYVLPIRSWMTSSLKSLYRALPDKHKIDMSKTASTIPQLRYAAYWFDGGHLNDKGSRLYTNAFAEEVAGTINFTRK